MGKKHIVINKLDELHQVTTPEVSIQSREGSPNSLGAKKVGRPKAAEKRVRFTLNIKESNVQLIRGGRLEEKFKNDSEFLDHILETYFSEKDYREQVLIAR